MGPLQSRNGDLIINDPGKHEVKNRSAIALAELVAGLR
jgi:hypothetical protein